MGGHCFCPPTFQDPGGEHAPPFFGTLGGKFLCAPPKKWGGTKSAKPKVMGGDKFHDLPPISPHFPPIFMIIPPFIWGENPKWMGGQLPPQMLPPHFSRPWGGNILCPPIGIFMGGLFFHGGKLQMGGKRHLCLAPYP